MFDKKVEYSLVFSGGGAKGAYEIGAWKALRELNIRINAVCGASVGALNAAIVAQDDYDLGVKIWSEMTLDKVVNVPDGMIVDGKPKFSLKNLTKIGDLNLKIKNLGLDPAPLHNLLKSEIKEDKIRRSGMDLGIVTIKVDNFHPCEIFLDEMPYGTLADYLLASASFPVFKRAEINGKQFADGGIYDNIPHAMMKNRGYRRIIVVDIDGLGANKRPDISGTQTIYIKTSMPLGKILDFNREHAMKAIDIGYLDTMKVFEKNDGIKYFIKHDQRTEKEYSDKLLSPEYMNKYSKYLKLNGRKCIADNAEALIREILPKEQRSHQDLLLCLLESAAASLNIERGRLYSVIELIEEVRLKHAEIIQKGAVPTKKQSESFLKRIEHTLSLFTSERELGDYCPYEYAKILGQNKTAKTLFPELVPAEIFLSLL